MHPPSMGTHDTPVPAGPVPFEDVKARLGAPAAEQSGEEEEDKIGGSSMECCPYKGFWVPRMFVRGAAALEQRFVPRPDDVIVASLPKCGTTWVVALTVATMMRRASPPRAADHPLRRLNPHQCLPFLEALFSDGQEAVLAALPSPRLMNTHLPLAFIPRATPAAGGGGCKVVYVCREPKDMVVSLYHYLRRVTPGLQFQDAFDSACNGTSVFGPFWDHFLGYWRGSVAWPDNVLFLRYEEMLRDPVPCVRRLARFVGQPFSAAEEEAGVVREIVDLCSLDNLRSMEHNKTGYVNPNIRFPREALFRKGTAGDWKNHITLEMAHRMDDIIADKFRDTGLTFHQL